MSRSTSPHNLLLRSLAPEDLHRLAPHLENVSLNSEDVLVQPNMSIEYAYFIEKGMASVVTMTPAGGSLEISNIGREGMAGVCLLLDLDQTPLRTFVQMTGSALRIRAEVLKEAMEESGSLRRKLLHYAHVVMMQTAETAVALARNTVSQRLARWLLLSHDRADGDEIPMTHERLALILGVRRSGVTVAMAELEAEHMIKSRRGKIIVRDRGKLIDMAGGSYGRSETEYRRVVSA